MLYIIYYQNNILEGPKYYLHEFPSKWSVGGIVVSIAAFQAIDPGSIPGQRIFIVLPLLLNPQIFLISRRLK